MKRIMMRESGEMRSHSIEMSAIDTNKDDWRSTKIYKVKKKGELISVIDYLITVYRG